MRETILENFVTALLNISVQTVIIFCVLFLVRALFFLCRVPKKYACFLWAILFVRLLMPVQPESPVGLWTKDSTLQSFVENPGRYFSGTTVGENGSVQGELQSAGNIDVSLRSRESEDMDMQEEQGESDMDASGQLRGVDGIAGQERLPEKEIQEDGDMDATRGIWRIVSVIWGTGCMGFLLYGGISCLLLKRKLQCSIKQEDNCYLTDGIPTAFVMGVFVPKIYLPSELKGEDLAYVILHERTHIKRRDYLFKMSAYLIACVYWFHPLVWAALILMSRDIELSCDEAVLRELGEGSRREYADTLLRLSDGKQHFAKVPLAFGEGDTESRIRHIVRYRRPAVAAVVLALVLLSGLAVCLLTGRTKVEEDDKSHNSVETFPEESGEDGGFGAALPREEGESAEPVFSDESMVRTSVTQENEKSIGENSPDSINSRFPEPMELSSGHIVAVTGDVYHITISIDGEAYQMADLCDAVNALEDIREFGEYIVVEGHISPDNGYYGLYSTESRQWVMEYIGSHLTWDENWETLGDPIKSVIYAEGSDTQGVIRDWKTSIIAVFDLEDEYVYDLKREGNDITITIVDFEGESRELHFDTKDS